MQTQSQPRPSATGRILMVGLLVGLMAASVAWSAPLTGVVLDARNGQPVRGATVTFEGAEGTHTSDIDGLILVDLPVGTYTATVTMENFRTQNVTDIVVNEDGTGSFAVVLESISGAEDDAAFSEAITVSADAELATETALLAERKNAIQISDSIGSEEMSKNTGSDAAGVLKRVTGISLQDNKYVFVRGLGDRYSSTALNGSKLPSTEFEKKVVPLDLFPADLIQKITVSKSYTVDKPADFAAGLVELSTVDFPAQQTGSVGLSLGWNSVTTGDDLFEYPGGLSFTGSGGQPLPGTIPDEGLFRFSPFTNRGFTADELEGFGEELIGSWAPVVDDSAPADTSFNFSYGNSRERLGYVVTATYEDSFSTVDEERTFFRVGADGGVVPDNEYRFDTSQDKVRLALTGNLAYKLAENHHLQLRTLFTNLSEGEGRFQEGFFSDLGSNINNYRVSYLEQDITNFQLNGDHYWGAGDGSLFEWRASFSEAETNENRREALYEEQPGNIFTYSDAAQSGFMYFNQLTDEVTDFKADWTSFFNGTDRFGNIKAGFAYTTNDRDFNGRRLRFFQRGSFGVDLTAPPEELFSADNINPFNFEIQEVTRATDTYLGEQEIPAAYVQGDYSFGNWRITGGVRVEDSQQDVITFDRNNPDNPPIVSEIEDTDILPSLGVVYNLGGDTNLRFSASQTLNRPEYRELAPFEFTHVVGGFTAVGNPDLQRAKITSFDARWEWFPSAREVVALSVFYKDFEDPIESLLLGGSLNFETFTNVEEAENFGLELELRRNLGVLSESLEDFNFILNYAFVDSEITIDPTVSAVTNATRPLVGQPDHVGNLILEWERPESGSNVRLLYNFVGDKVSFAGGFGLPDVLEESRGTIDFVWGQDLPWAGFRFKLSGSNLNDEERLWTQGGGTWRLYDAGRSISASLSWSPFAR